MPRHSFYYVYRKALDRGVEIKEKLLGNCLIQIKIKVAYWIPDTGGYRKEGSNFNRTSNNTGKKIDLSASKQEKEINYVFASF